MTSRPCHRRWSAFGKLGLVAGLAVLATPLTSSAASLPDPCHLLTRRRRPAFWEQSRGNNNHPLANGFCVYSAPPENSSATAPPSIAVTVKTSQHRPDSGCPAIRDAPRRAFGLPPGVAEKDLRTTPAPTRRRLGLLRRADPRDSLGLPSTRCWGRSRHRHGQRRRCARDTGQRRQESDDRKGAGQSESDRERAGLKKRRALPVGTICLF